MALADSNGMPIGIEISSASPHEVTLVEITLEARFIDALPERLIGDGAYDSDPLDEELAEKGIEVIAPHKTNRVRPTTQDGRAFRRYRKRWKIERMNSWLQNFRRVLTRWEWKAQNFRAMVEFACCVILARRL